MWISDSWQDFEVLDCSRGEKLERWGKYTLVRPDPQAIWDTPRTDPRWRTADGRYSRSHTGGGNEHAKAVCPCGYGKIPSLLGGAVGGVDVTFVGNAQRRQGIHGFAQDGQIAVAAHDDSDFFHVLTSLWQIKLHA